MHIISDEILILDMNSKIQLSLVWSQLSDNGLYNSLRTEEAHTWHGHGELFTDRGGGGSTHGVRGRDGGGALGPRQRSNGRGAGRVHWWAERAILKRQKGERQIIEKKNCRSKPPEKKSHPLISISVPPKTLLWNMTTHCPTALQLKLGDMCEPWVCHVHLTK